MAALLLGSIVGCGGPGARLAGRVEGGTYTSPGGWFSLSIPTGSNPFVKEFEIADAHERGHWPGAPSSAEVGYDHVTFLIRDFGELYVAEVCSIPPPVLEQMAGEPPEDVRSGLADMFLTDMTREMGGEPEVVRDVPFESHLGPALLRVYRVPEGSLLIRIQDGQESRFDVLTAVVVLLWGDRAVSLIAENDYRPLDEDGLVSRTRATFAGLQLAPPASNEGREGGDGS